MSQMRGVGLNEKLTIELSQGELGHLRSLVRNNLRKAKREHAKPQAQAQRERYFAEHPEKSGLAAHLIAREQKLLAKLDEAFGAGGAA